MANKFNITQITYDKVKSEIEYYLKTIYNKAGETFSAASPFGHIMASVEALYQNVFLYIKSIVNMYSITETNLLNERIVSSSAILAGHNPTRAVSATGSLRLRLKSFIDSESSLGSTKITFRNYSRLKNKTNGLEYIIDLGGNDIQTFDLKNNTPIILNIIQGEFKEDFFTTDGSLNQSLQVNNQSKTKQIENFFVKVYINGELYSVKNHLYEMGVNEKAVVVKSSVDGGINVILGGDGFGFVPEIGSPIQVKYLLSSGNAGNIYRRTPNDFDFIEQPIDGFGVTVDVNSLFEVLINNDINFGADKESIRFTRSILPLASSNYVLATPQQYAYHIMQMGVFSHVNAYLKNGYIVISVTPNVSLFKNKNSDYFTVSEEAFKLDSYEKIKIDKFLKSGGNIQLTQKYRITAPTLSYYILNILVITYSDSNDEETNQEIISRVSEYFLNLTRMGRIPRKDILTLIADIPSVDSVDISFISRKNEDYHRKYIQEIKQANKTINSDPNLIAGDIGINDQNMSDIRKTNVNTNYNPNTVLGLDPLMGDILFDANEYPIIRGGWFTRDDVYFDTDMASSNLKSINIIKKGSTDKKQLMK